MRTILDEAEARVTDVKTNAQSRQAQQVEAMLEEIGRQHHCLAWTALLMTNWRATCACIMRRRAREA